MSKTEKQIDDILKNWKPTCCNEGWYRKGRANLRCIKCDKDVTLDIVLIHQALTN